MINDVIVWFQGKLGVPGLPGYPGRQGPKVRENTYIDKTDSLLHPGLRSHSLSPGDLMCETSEMLKCWFVYLGITRLPRIPWLKRRERNKSKSTTLWNIFFLKSDYSAPHGFKLLVIWVFKSELFFVNNVAVWLSLHRDATDGSFTLIYIVSSLCLAEFIIVFCLFFRVLEANQDQEDKEDQRYHFTLYIHSLSQFIKAILFRGWRPVSFLPLKLLIREGQKMFLFLRAWY